MQFFILYYYFIVKSYKSKEISKLTYILDTKDDLNKYSEFIRWKLLKKYFFVKFFTQRLIENDSETHCLSL